jgi:subfamily B ATP-binding cassette protein MsbA
VLLFSLLSAAIASLIKQVREISFIRTKARGEYTSAALEFINGIRTVQAFAAQDFERQKFYESSDKILQSEVKYSKLSALIEPLTESVATTILVGMLVVAFATLIPTGQLQIASLLTFLFILFRMMPLVRQLNGARARLSNFQGSINNINELLRTDNKTYLLTGTKPFSGLRYKIEFQSVDFGYYSERSVLQDINLTFEQGKTTALVGASGAGKSTLVDLIPRFYEPTHGRILIDGIDLKTFDIHSLRRQIAVVSQDTFIFNNSVQNNIAYAMINSVSQDEIIEAARQANALEFIQELPQGFNTQLGDRGIRLSGGQRQRLAIARALLRDPEILILDEATSALDSVSERLIQESLEKLSVGRTVIAIAHRLSTIIGADKVVVLEQGKVVEEGTYQELLKNKGKLWKYHQIQHNLNQTKMTL